MMNALSALSTPVAVCAIILSLIFVLTLTKAVRSRGSYRASWWFTLAGLSVLGVIFLLSSVAAMFHMGERVAQPLRQYTGDQSLEVSCSLPLDRLFAVTQPDEDVWRDVDGVIMTTNDLCGVLLSYATLDEKGDVSGAQALTVHAFNRAVMRVGAVTLAEAECYATQYDHLFAEALGATEEEGVLLRDTYVEEIAPEVGAELRHPECRAGGSLHIRQGIRDPLF